MQHAAASQLMGRSAAAPPPAAVSRHCLPGTSRCLQHRRSIFCSAATKSDVASLKADIVRAVGGTNRGKTATPAQRAAILQHLTALEACNTVQDPTASPMLSGTWALLYQAPLTEAAAKDKASTLEGPFLAAFQPLTRGIVRTKANLQRIDLPNQRVQNLAEFTIFGRWDGALNIVGSAVAAPTAPGEANDKVEVTFVEFVLSLGGWKGRLPLDSVKPRGWLKTTYLDNDFRVGRGDKGSIFVAAKINGGAQLEAPGWEA